MTCIKCTKYLKPKDGLYSKWKFGVVLCIACSPMKKYDSKGKPIEPKALPVEPEASAKEQTAFLETNRIEDIPFI